MKSVNRTLGYSIVVGDGVLAEVGDWVAAGSEESVAGAKPNEKARKAAIISTSAVSRFSDEVAESLNRSGLEPRVVVVPDGEAAKELGVLSDVWQSLSDFGLARSDCIVAVGGGATTDFAGFVAATWMRGVDLIHVPTSLLAMVDAAIGGKTAINTARAKNLVGAFHDPKAVVCDLATLDTLPVEEMRSGLAEVIKSGLIADDSILTRIESASFDASKPEPELSGEGEIFLDKSLLGELITSASDVKVSVVSEDPLEQSQAGVGRMILNYGHTVGHAIERIENLNGEGLRHGEAIALGMVFAAELAVAAGISQPAFAERHRRLIQAVGLPTRYEGKGFDDVFEYVKLDKKVRASELRFVLLRQVGQPELLTAPSDELLHQAWHKLVDK